MDNLLVNQSFAIGSAHFSVYHVCEVESRSASDAKEFGSPGAEMKAYSSLRRSGQRSCSAPACEDLPVGFIHQNTLRHFCGLYSYIFLIVIHHGSSG